MLRVLMLLLLASLPRAVKLRISSKEPKLSPAILKFTREFIQNSFHGLNATNGQSEDLLKNCKTAEDVDSAFARGTSFFVTEAKA